MTVIFPEKLPYPTTEGYAIKPGEAIVRSALTYEQLSTVMRSMEFDL